MAIKSLDLTREAIAEAEYRLAKLPAQQNAIESFLEETRLMLTPEQQVIISRRKSLEKSLAPLEGELINDSTKIISEFDDR
jgi:predicted  nucleic acid-binding Zn-ribbon protein